MLYYLSLLRDYFSPLNVFQYANFRAICAALTALLLSIWIGPLVIRTLTRMKLGQPIRGKEDHVHVLADLHGGKKGTPTMGGIMIVITVAVSCLLWGVLTNMYLWLALGSMLAFAAIGFVDDYAKIRKKKADGLTSRQKLFCQAVVAALVGGYLLWNPATRQMALTVEIPYTKIAPLVDPTGGAIVFVFFLLVVIGSSNAVNLTDGLDGLASGCTVSVTVVYSIFAYLISIPRISKLLLLPHVPGAEELTIFCTALGGAALGFLWFNCHPAKMFMGDTGSLAIGGMLGAVAICCKQEILLVIVGGVFVMEAMSVILQVASFKLTGKRIIKMSPIHHHFELSGWKENTVIVRFWIMSILFALLGLATLKLR